ncbi:hypothetical protein L249_3926 [Ophiocordyceps polyrhachis-furcata BCC 54312]|uniref:RRM domain-containing protein n=1 Tax=Ophiocordyceps polyrhachis-furcata BCC 54312 TaxID=1330021 RepID=A0A367L532_9HYPO|nr:hypothetical protein L249_3926 [Ophiocordyceps polyrhachis-furcata BCC 54312]
MAAAGFLPASHTYRPLPHPQSPYHSMSMSHIFDSEPAQPTRSTFPTSSDYGARVLIRGLPLNTTEESLRFMIAFTNELPNFELLPEEDGTRSALLTFRTSTAATEVKSKLDGRNVSDTELIVDLVERSPTTPASSRQPFTGSIFHLPERVSPPSTGVIPPQYFLSKESSTTAATSLRSLFSSHAPIGNHRHLADRPRISGKLLISSDMGEDDETRDLLKDPVAYAESGAQRRATVPHLPLSRVAGLSLNTNTTSGPSSLSYMRSQSPSSAPGPPSLGYNSVGPYQARQSFPPVNPADQNPPCNTLYVGNLPIDTSEEELKAMFSKQRGYKRLCFRTKQNGPMCFVEFEDISFATKALNELYGQPLHNSVKGGIRLSFSKNPLGVRSGQGASSGAGGLNGAMVGNLNGFAIVHGPPPGLTAPPGLPAGRRGTYNMTPPMNTGGRNAHRQGSMSGFPASTASYAWNTPVYPDSESNKSLHGNPAQLPRHALR